MNRYSLEFIQSECQEARQHIEQEIDRLKAQLCIIDSIDWQCPISEGWWHELCKTPLRHSQALGALVKNTFPEAENISVGSNYVFFLMYDIQCVLSTSACHTAMVDLRWYYKGEKQPYMKGDFNRERYAQVLADKVLPKLEGWTNNLQYFDRRTKEICSWNIQNRGIFKEQWSSKQPMEQERD